MEINFSKEKHASMDEGLLSLECIPHHFYFGFTSYLKLYAIEICLHKYKMKMGGFLLTAMPHNSLIDVDKMNGSYLELKKIHFLNCCAVWGYIVAFANVL
jgi:hypothetical protein